MSKILRKTSREAAFIILFEKYFNRDESLDELYELAAESDIPINDDVCNKAEGVLENIDEINNIISEFSKKRSLERISAVDRVILSLAVYEIKFDDAIPTNVAVSEAVRLTQGFAFSEDVAYVNGVLASYVKSLDKLNNLN